jgi:hypothetical protein
VQNDVRINQTSPKISSRDQVDSPKSALHRILIHSSRATALALFCSCFTCMPTLPLLMNFKSVKTSKNILGLAPLPIAASLAISSIDRVEVLSTFLRRNQERKSQAKKKMPQLAILFENIGQFASAREFLLHIFDEYICGKRTPRRPWSCCGTTKGLRGPYIARRCFTTLASLSREASLVISSTVQGGSLSISPVRRVSRFVAG